MSEKYSINRKTLESLPQLNIYDILEIALTDLWEYLLENMRR